MRIVVFSGTADGRKMCELLSAHGADVTAYVATEYGAELMRGADVKAGRLGKEGICGVISDADAVVDATHPYAKVVSENISSACSESGKRYFRLIRETTACDEALYFDSVASAADYLRGCGGRVFVSTGSKELGEFSVIGDRVSARVLDTPEVREKCAGLGIDNLMFKTPPFSYEDDLTDFAGCKYLVTKDGGKTGGMPEKLRAAKHLGMTVLIIRRPKEKNGGMSFDELEHCIYRLMKEGADDEKDNSGQP